MSRLTVDKARQMTFSELNEAVYGMVEEYAQRHEQETVKERDARIGRTLDGAPDVYAWILTLHAYFDHWTDVAADQFGRGDIQYKIYRQKRDLCENAAKAMKLRYDGASRRITQLEAHQEAAGMGRGR